MAGRLVADGDEVGDGMGVLVGVMVGLMEVDEGGKGVRVADGCNEADGVDAETTSMTGIIWGSASFFKGGSATGISARWARVGTVGLGVPVIGSEMAVLSGSRTRNTARITPPPIQKPPIVIKKMASQADFED